MEIQKHVDKVEQTATNLVYWGAAVSGGALVLIVVLKLTKKLRGK